MVELTLESIHDKQFHVRFRGFDVDEVDEFLELISENYATLIKENQVLKNKVKELSEQLEGVNNQESSFKNAIISAQKIADQMIQKSKEEAEKIISESHEEAKSIKDEALKEVSALEERVDKLKDMQSNFERDIQMVIDNYQDSLDNNLSEPKGEESPEQEVETTPKESDTGSGAALTKTEPDLSDLYEKIDLNEDLTPVSSPKNDQYDISLEANKFLAEGMDLSGENLGSDEDPNKINIPDLDSDLMFTLHDPLDDENEQDVDVKIDLDIDK